MLIAFAKALDTAITDELELANQVSDEEWDAIRPTKLERRNYLLNTMKVCNFERSNRIFYRQCYRFI